MRSGRQGHRLGVVEDVLVVPDVLGLLQAAVVRLVITRSAFPPSSEA
ncbi:hypothetical protein KPATCC21470_1178 [Kitasatospora purpeofusca]